MQLSRETRLWWGLSGAVIRRAEASSNVTVNTNASTPASDLSTADIAQYATALNGVNQAQNDTDKTALWWSIGVLCLLVLGIRAYQAFTAHIRHLHGLSPSEERQRFWAQNNSELWPKLKKHLVYAPLGNKRHNREIRLTSALHMGTLPSRAHALILTCYITSNIIYCAWLDYQQNRYANLAELRGRSGTLAIANMIPLIILAGRNNPLIPLLGVSFDTYNLLHRWIGRVIVVQILIHTIAYLMVKVVAAQWSGVMTALATDPFIGWGTVSLFCMTIILFTSVSPLRHAFYETFLNLHIVLAFTSILGAYLHCEIAGLPQLLWLRWILVLWAAERFFRLARTLYNSFSQKGFSKATVTLLPGEACRVTVHLPRRLHVAPGSHAYLRFGQLNIWESHPFSIAWTDNIESSPSSPRLPVTEKRHPTSPSPSPSISSRRMPHKDTRGVTTDVSFIIHAQTGITRRLHTLASRAASKHGDDLSLSLPILLEGPYAGHNSLDSYGHCVLFAGSSGITHQIPYIRHLLQGYADGMVATKRITLIWIVREVEHLSWIRVWMDQILRMQGRRDVLVIKLFVTRPKSAGEIVSPSETVRMFPGRPNVEALLREEIVGNPVERRTNGKLRTGQVGAMCVTVCGPGSLADSVRAAVRDVQELGVVDFIEESFTW